MQVNANIDLSVAFPGQHKATTFVPTRAGTNGTLIAVILDESGSMGSCWAQTISGFNEFVAGQAAAQGAGAAYLSLIKFDAPHIKTVYENQLISQVQPLNRETYTPNGGTNLMDVIGETMNRINSFLSSMQASERPGVLIVIITDGAENSSTRFNTVEIKSMVAAAESDGDWSFTFLGANVYAFAMGATFGMNAANTAAYTTSNMAQTMSVLSEAAVKVRAAKSAGVSTQELYASQAFYKDSDRNRMVGRE